MVDNSLLFSQNLFRQTFLEFSLTKIETAKDPQLQSLIGGMGNTGIVQAHAVQGFWLNKFEGMEMHFAKKNPQFFQTYQPHFFHLELYF